MAVPQYRPLQTTATTGTGTLTLDAAASNVRSFQDAFGVSSVKLRYVIAWASGYEIGVGTYNGASPGTLTRDTVIASSNAGALVTLAAGTKDVFVTSDFDRPINSISGGTTLAIADLGNLVSFTGTSSATINLPAVSTVPPGAGFQIANAGTLANGAIITLDPNGSETLNGATTAVIAPGETATIWRVGSAWVVAGLGAGFVSLRRQTLSGGASVGFVLPSEFEGYQVRFRMISAASGTPDLIMRFSTDGGSTYISSAASYAWGGLLVDSGPVPLAVNNGSVTEVLIVSNTAGACGIIDVHNARDASIHTTYESSTGPARASVSYQRQIYAGQTLATGDHNALQLIFNTGALFAAGGVVTLLGLR
jgi:hypothetical protein